MSALLHAQHARRDLLLRPQHDTAPGTRTTGPQAPTVVGGGAGPVPEAAWTDAYDSGPLSGTAEIRRVTGALFARLADLTPGTSAHDEVRDLLIRHNLPMVRYVANRFRHRNEPYEDIVQVGTIGLIKAIDRFDPHRGVQFPSYAMPTIIGEIKRHFRDSGWSLRVPRRVQELWLSVSEAVETLSQVHDRRPTVAEMAVYLGVTPEEVVACLEATNAYATASLDATDIDERSLADRLGYHDQALEGVEYREALRPLVLALPPRERRILMLRFFSNMTQAQIAAELGISQMHVSRLLSRTLARLREGLTAD